VVVAMRRDEPLAHFLPPPLYPSKSPPYHQQK
jgi:hypothetical protein